MVEDRLKTKRQLVRELVEMRQRIAQVETSEAEQLQAEQHARRQAENLAAIGQLAIKLTSAPSDQDLYQLLAESLKSITGALATGVSVYSPVTKDLELKYLAASGWFLLTLNKILGRHAKHIRVPVSPQLYQQMVTEVSRIAEDMTTTTFGAVPRPLAAAAEATLGIGSYAGLALHDGGELMGTAVMIMPKDHPEPSEDLLRTFAHLAAVSMRRQQAEMALRESEERYRMLVDTSPDGILLMDMEANVLTVNKEMLNLCGYTQVEEMVGQSALEFLVPEQRQQAVDEISDLANLRVLRGKEFNVLRQDGTVFPAELSASLVVDGHDGPQAMIVIVRNISGRKAMEEALRRRAHELDMLNRAGQALNATLDLEEAVDTTIEKACALLNVDACSMWLIVPETGELECCSAVGSHAEVVRGWRLPPGQGLAGWIVQNGQSLIVPDAWADERYDKSVEEKTGEPLHSILGVPMRVKEEIIGVLEVLDAGVDRFQDTDRALLESMVMSAAIAVENARLYQDLQDQMEELQRTQARLIQSAKMAAVGELAAGVAHELNNPLTAVLGFSELLLERIPPEDPNYKRLRAIARQAGRVRDIVQNLLNFSRQTEFHQAPSDLNQVLRESLSLIRLRLKANGVVIREHYDFDLPPLPLDTGRMKQVFLNLFTNALHAMPDGGTLTIFSEQVEGQVAIRIADTGSGIAAAHLPRIFEPFYTTKPVGDGSGLGLSVSLGIVQDHGGQIEVESEQSRGTTFIVWLPLNGRSDVALSRGVRPAQVPAIEAETSPVLH